MIGSTVVLQLVNLLFNLTPLTRGFGLRARLLRMAGVDCARSARVVASARIVITNVSIGEDTFIGHQVLITGSQKARITIGSFVDIAPRVVIVSGSHKIDMVGEHSAGTLTTDKVLLEDGVWIGANSTVLPGVTIGRKAVVGAGSVVTRDIPPFCVAVGNPCRPMRQWNFNLNCFSHCED
jgi:acetyltransferase-like isoleucine patch superfamily enzyme